MKHNFEVSISKEGPNKKIDRAFEYHLRISKTLPFTFIWHL